MAVAEAEIEAEDASAKVVSNEQADRQGKDRGFGRYRAPKQIPSEMANSAFSHITTNLVTG